MAKRLKAMGQAKYQNDGDPRTSGPGFGLTVHLDTLTDPLHWRTPRRVFVNSMSDLFHARVPRDFVAQVFATMAATPQHTYQILTKRPGQMRRIVNADGFCDLVAEHAGPLPGRPMGYAWPLGNVWLGTSIENEDYIGRADHLRRTDAAVRFISAEPLLGPLAGLNLAGIDWLIIGGESGSGARPLELRWVRELIEMARDSGTAVFVKQLGSVWAGDTSWNGAPASRWDKKGGDPLFWPADLNVREYPGREI